MIPVEAVPVVASFGPATRSAVALSAGDTRRSRRPLAGPQLGVFVPALPAVRERFGDRWTNIGFGVGAVRAPARRGAWSADVSVLSNRRTRGDGQGSALVVPFGAEYRVSIGEPSGLWRPYGGGMAGGLLAWVDDPASTKSVAGRFAPSGGVFLGVAYRDRAYVELHGYAFGRTGDWRLGGFNFAAGFRF